MKGLPVHRFLLVIILSSLLLSCITLESRSTVPSLSLSSEEIDTRIETLERELTNKAMEAHQAAEVHLQLSYLYIHPSKKQKQYQKAYLHLQSYIQLIRDAERDYYIQEKLQMLKEIITLKGRVGLLEKKTCESFEINLNECTQEVSSLNKKIDVLNQEKLQLLKEIQQHKKKIKELHKKIDQLLHIEMEIQKKKKRLEQR